uniref:Predicted protein n=1 Tax=Physcomitrium patens TaxID=3218 RepID=A9U544_PHYPA
MRPNLVGQSIAVQLWKHPGLTTGLLANMRPELVKRFNVVPITGLRFRFRLFRTLCHSENVLSVKRSLKGSQWIQGREYKAVLEITRLGCSRFSVTSRDLPAGEKRFWRAVVGHPYRFTIYSCNRLYSNSQKPMDCLNISESPHYLLQPDVRPIIEQKSM